MLQILALYLNEEGHVQHAVPLEIFPDTSLDFVWENPLFKMDEITVSFSLSFPIPASTHNLKIFRFPNRVTAWRVNTAIPAAIRHTGVTIAEGELLLINYENDLQLQFKGSLEDVDQQKNLDELERLDELEFDVPYPPKTPTFSGEIDYNSPAWADYVNQALAASNQIAPYQPYCHAPVKKASQRQWDGGHESVGGLINSIKQYVNYYNPVTGNYRLQTSAWYNPTDPWNVGGGAGALGDPTKRFHSPLVPFLPLHRIIDAAMPSSLKENPYLDDDLYKIVIVGENHHNNFLDFVYNSFHVHGYSLREVTFPVSETTDDNILWKYQSFMQAYRFNEFLKDILKIFCQTLFRGLRSSIEYKEDTLDEEVVVSWENKLDGDLVITRQPPQEYRFEYQGEGAQFEGDINTKATWAEVFAEAIEQHTAGVISDHADEGEYFYKVEGFPQIVGIKKTLRTLHNDPWLECRIVKTALGNEYPETKKEVFRVTSNVKPLDMSIEQYWWLNRNVDENESPIDIIRRGHWHVPVMPDQRKEDAPYIMLSAGMKNTFYQEDFPGAGSYPYLTNHHTDQFGNKTLDFSLIPGVEDGLIDKFHHKFKKWVEKEKVEIQGLFLLDVHDLHKIDMRHKFAVRGRLFYIKTINFSITPTHISKSEVTLIEI